jgi:hypothetical protein
MGTSSDKVQSGYAEYLVLETEDDKWLSSGLEALPSSMVVDVFGCCPRIGSRGGPASALFAFSNPVSRERGLEIVSLGLPRVLLKNVSFDNTSSVESSWWNDRTAAVVRHSMDEGVERVGAPRYSEKAPTLVISPSPPRAG